MCEDDSNEARRLEPVDGPETNAVELIEASEDDCE